MPTSTFFNLRPEKQERLLTAAAREFAAQPFHEASINSMIRAAGIPRGSFYMYFRDKEELFQYLVRESTEPLLLAFRELLTRSGGDLFDANRACASICNPIRRTVGLAAWECCPQSWSGTADCKKAA